MAHRVGPESIELLVSNQSTHRSWTHPETLRSLLQRHKATGTLRIERREQVVTPCRVNPLLCPGMPHPCSQPKPEELEKSYPTNTLLKVYWLPTIKRCHRTQQGQFIAIACVTGGSRSL